jgi:multimeric flavodoxin WrbA
MKTLIINASPRKNGTIDRFLQKKASLAEKNSTVLRLNTHDLIFSECNACMLCRSLNKCILPEDDAHKFGDMLVSADYIIIGSPVYWGNIPGKLKMLFDRNVYKIMDTSKPGIPVKKLKGKKAQIITSCSVPGIIDFLTGQSKGCRKAIKTILKSGGIRIEKNIALKNSRKQINTSSSLPMVSKS